MTQTKLWLALSSVALMVISGCQGSLSANETDLASSVGSVVGTRLVGAKGATNADQNKIDDTVTRLCATGAWTRAQCIRHDEATQ